MYYSAIGLPALILLLIENSDVFLRRSDAVRGPVWGAYRRFLLAVAVYYLTDILWGILEGAKLSAALFADTTVYFVAMAAGVLMWTRYIVTYLDARSPFSRFLVYAGQTIAALVALLALANLFYPVLFTVDEACVYHTRPLRYVVLCLQVLLLVVLSVYAFSAYRRLPDGAAEGRKYRMLGYFGLIMAVCLLAQLWFPYLPLYSISYLLGTSLLRTFVVTEEKAGFRHQLRDAERIKELQQTIRSLLDNMPGITFCKEAETGVYLACNQAFAEYAHKDTPEGVVGLTDAEIFDADTAARLAEDDRMVLSMDVPFIFCENVLDAKGNPIQLENTKLKYVDMEGRRCILGLCLDVTEKVRVQREDAMTKEDYEKARSTGILYSHAAQSLARGYLELYYVNIDSEEYIEYRNDEGGDTLTEVRRGWHFFEQCQIEAEERVYPDDRAAFLKALDRKTLVAELERNRSFGMNYRVLTAGEPKYVSLQVTFMEGDERRIVIGVTDVDAQMRERGAALREEEERIAYARINALTGDFLCIYVVDPETGHYREIRENRDYDAFGQRNEGEDFFGAVREAALTRNHPDDHSRFLSTFTRENVMAEIARRGIFTLSYRLLRGDGDLYVQLKAAKVEEAEGVRLIVGINDVDAQVRQEEAYVQNMARARISASIDPLTGVKNRHAYLEAEERLNAQLDKLENLEFAVVLLDLNDLKKVNDTEGHDAGDRYIREACKIICNFFKRSPVFRIGGDEFAVISQGDDYADIDALVERLAKHNAEAQRTGGVVIACGMAKRENEKSVAPVFARADRRMYENKSGLKAKKEQRKHDK